VTRPSLYILMFPILFIAGFGTVAARVFAVAIAAVRARSGGFSPASYLAVHRLAGAPLLTLPLVAASALSLGVFVQAQTMVGSLRATVDAKAKVYVGSDVQGRIGHETPSPERFAMPITRVTRLLDAGDLATGSAFDLLAIDPESFAAAAYWNDGFAGSPLPDIVRRVAAPRGDAVAAVVARDGVPDATTVLIGGVRVPIEVVGRADAFPGMSSLRPLLVVDAGALVAAFAAAGHANPLDAPDASTELWVKGEAHRAEAALARVEYPPYLVLTADEVKDIPAIGAVIDTFLVLNTLGIAAALFVIGGILMYLQARQRSQVVSYGLSLRMGMSHESHRRSLALELGAMLCSSYGVGAALAIVAALLVVPLLDPLSSIPPGPLFVAPRISIAAAFAALVGIAWFGAWFTNLRARSMDLGEVMRLAD
jgi:putative ABC transport system permease protein